MLLLSRPGRALYVAFASDPPSSEELVVANPKRNVRSHCNLYCDLRHNSDLNPPCAAIAIVDNSSRARIDFKKPGRVRRVASIIFTTACKCHASRYRKDIASEGVMDTGIYDLKWGQDLAAKISKQLNTEIGRIRAEPPLIPVVLSPSRYEDVVQSYRIAPPPGGAAAAIQPKSISSKNSKLSPIKISSHFVVAQHQFSDEALVARLAIRCASDLAFAEDDIILNGDRANLRAKNIKDDSDTLDEQEGLLVAAPAAVAEGTDVVGSILLALQELQRRNHHGPYCVIVSPDLHREALTPAGGSSTPRIDPILPQLRHRGFRWSQAAAPRTGVAFSLGGGALDLPILWDAHVECRKVEGDATFAVVQQFRLRINDPTAVQPLS